LNGIIGHVSTAQISHEVSDIIKAASKIIKATNLSSPQAGDVEFRVVMYKASADDIMLIIAGANHQPNSIVKVIQVTPFVQVKELA